MYKCLWNRTPDNETSASDNGICISVHETVPDNETGASNDETCTSVHETERLTMKQVYEAIGQDTETSLRNIETQFT